MRLRVTRFRSYPLPEAVDAAVRERLAAAHAEQPFSPLDPRLAARRVSELLADLGLSVTLFRGGLDLRGVEVDHVWLAATAEGTPRVLDAAFPLFSDDFVTVLRRFVFGDGSRAELAAAAEGLAVDDRVLGVFPAPVGYLGKPVWSAR